MAPRAPWRDDTVIEGIGGSYLYFMADGADPYAEWAEMPGWREAEAANNVGLDLLDHLTHNVRRGQMQVWSAFYKTLFGFEEQKYFDIKGQATGLFSQAMIAPDRAIRIPLNESQDDKSQIEEFIREYKGEGIQHLALTTPDIYDTVERLRARGVRLQDTIETYYETRRYARARPWRGSGAAAAQPHPDRRRGGRGRAAAADLHRADVRPRSSSRSSSARAMRASATAISKPCSRASSWTRSGAA